MIMQGKMILFRGFPRLSIRSATQLPVIVKKWFRSVLLLIVFPPLVWGASNGRDMTREAEIEATLTQLDPTMLEPFRAARVAYDRDDYAESARLNALVAARLPNFDPAFRRWGASLARQGKRAEGIKYCEKAVAINRSVANLSTLANTLAFPREGTSSTQEQERALALLVECRPLPRGQDDDILSGIAQLALQLERMPEAREAVSALQSRYPGTLATHY
jgi:hypothetical protein